MHNIESQNINWDKKHAHATGIWSKLKVKVNLGKDQIRATTYNYGCMHQIKGKLFRSKKGEKKITDLSL